MTKEHSVESPTAPPLLTNEVARMLDVSADTVRLWERSGRLPAIKTATGVRLFDREDVERLARERETGGPAGAATVAHE